MTPQITITPAKSYVMQSKSIESVLKHIDNDKTLVLLDIDNTIFEPVDGRGSQQWVTTLIKHAHSLGLDSMQAHDALAELFFDIQMSAAVQAVEQSVISMIKNLQEQTIPVVGLTARSHPIVQRTIDQLSSISIDLSHTSLRLIKAWETAHLLYPEQAAYTNGVVFSGFNPKGDLLTTLLQHTGFVPEKIIFVDDQIKYLASVEKSAAELNIPFIGIHYTYLDEKVRNFVIDQESITRCFAQKTL